MAVIAAGAMTLAPAISVTGASAATRSPVTLNMYLSGDVNVQNVWLNDLIPQFEKSHPDIKINLIFSQHGTLDPSILAKVTASAKAKQVAPFDIIENGPVLQLAQANLLEKLNRKEIPLLSHIDSSLLQASRYEAMPYRGSSVVIAYNSEFVKTPPKSLRDLLNWIKKNPGKFTYNTPSSGGSGSAFVQAVLKQYIPKKYQSTFSSGYEPNLEKYWTKGFDELKTLAPDIYRNGFYPNGNVAVLQLLGSGAIYMAPVWSDQALTYLAQNQLPPSVKLVQLTPVLNGGPAYLGIPNNSKYKHQAEILFNWLLSPNVQTVVINKLNAFPGVQWKYLPVSLQKKFAAVAASYSQGFSTQFRSDMNSQWQSNVASN
jgi:putative spermidine/putrescine transport system substrate-binding protein